MAHFSPYAEELCKNAKFIASRGKGILAADESTGTIGKRFAPINVENTEENRLAYRQLLFKTEGLGDYISGAILYEETLFQKADDGTPFVDVLNKQGVLPGIKIDKGISPIAGTDGETATEGLDGLLARCQKYYAAGARFSKWRAVLKIGENEPSLRAVTENAHTLARMAVVSQMAGLVPIVEPEILADGTHSIEKCAEATERVLAAVFKALSDQGLLLEGALLKPNMVTPGSSAPAVPASQVAFYTVRALKRTVPPALPGIMFLSGGQSEEDATCNLNAMNKYDLPWTLSFSFGRALQASVLKTWKGEAGNVAAAQASLTVRAKANGQAQLGKYTGDAAGGAASESLFVPNYKY